MWIAEPVDGGSGGTARPAAGGPAVGEHGGTPGGGVSCEAVDPPLGSLQLTPGNECADLLHAVAHALKVRRCQQPVLSFRSARNPLPPFRTHTASVNKRKYTNHTRLLFDGVQLVAAQVLPR